MQPDLSIISIIGHESRNKLLGSGIGKHAYRSSCGIIEGEFGYKGVFEMMEFVSKIILPKKSKAADLGSADGIITFLTAEYGYKSYGFEIQEKSVAIAREYQSRFNKTERTIFVHGDWQLEPTYKKANIQFEDINFLYIYPGSEGLQKVYDMVSKQSKPGTILAVKESFEDERATRPENLEFIKFIECDAIPIRLYRKTG